MMKMRTFPRSRSASSKKEDAHASVFAFGLGTPHSLIHRLTFSRKPPSGYLEASVHFASRERPDPPQHTRIVIFGSFFFSTRGKLRQHFSNFIENTPSLLVLHKLERSGAPRKITSHAGSRQFAIVGSLLSQQHTLLNSIGPFIWRRLF